MRNIKVNIMIKFCFTGGSSVYNCIVSSMVYLKFHYPNSNLIIQKIFVENLKND